MAGIAHVITPDSASGAQVIDGSLRFDGSDSNRLIRTFSAGNRTSWTWSCWTKRDKLTLSNRQVIFGGYSASNNTDWLEIGWDNDDDHVYWTSNGVTSDGTAQRRDPASWYHFFSTYDGSNLKIYVNNRLDLDYSVTGNMGINVAGAHYIGQTPKNAEDRHLDGRLTQCYFIDGQALTPDSFGFTDPLTNTWRPKKYTGAFTRSSINDGTVWSNYITADPGTVNSSNPASNIFDSSLTSFSEPNTSGAKMIWTPPSDILLTQDLELVLYGGTYDFKIGTTALDQITGGGSGDNWTALSGSSGMTIGPTSPLTLDDAATNWWYVYAIKINGEQLIDGLNDSGVNSFYLPLDGNSPIGQDQSGQGNNWTPQNFSGTSVDPDVLKDSPSGAVYGGPPTSGITTTSSPISNYATLNPLDVDGSTGTHVLANGNLEVNTFATNYSTLASTITFDPGDPNGFYFESTGTNSAQYAGVGVAEAGTISGITGSPGRDGNKKQMLIRSDGYWYYNSASALTSGKTTWTSSDVIGCAFKNNKIWVSKNGVYIESGDPVTEANPNLTWDPANHTNDKVNFIVSAYTSNPTVTVNFGQKPFKYAPPDGFQALNAVNVRPSTVISRPDQYVGVTTYNAAGGNQIITLGFKPDLIISKSRDFSYAWDWEDIVRGGGFRLKSSSGDAAGDYCSNAAIREWRRDGVRCSSNMNATYDGGGVGGSVSYGFVAGNTAIPECGAISFDGTGDYLTFASTSAFLEDAGYTIDGWIYLLSAPADSNGEIIFDTGSGGNDPELNVYADGSGNIQLYDSLSNNTNWNGGASYMNVGQWYYFKQTVDGSSASDASATHKLYIDGQLGVTNTINLSSRSASSAASIAARTDGSVIGHFILSNLRYRDTVDNSTDVPTAPFTGSEANTVLLCCNQPAPADDNADPTDSTTTPSTITKQGNPGNANITIFGRFTKDGVAHPSVAAAGLSGGNLTITGASVGTKNGFSIIRYNGNNSTGQTVKHGLTQKPDFIIVKNISQAYDWMIYHKSMGADYYGLFGAYAFLNDADIWADTEPTDSQFSVSVHNSPAGYSNGPNGQFISYIWHDVPGLQKFGSFEGNDAADGPFIELGFRPSVILLKNADATESWVLIDGTRDAFNPSYKWVQPNTNVVENTTTTNNCVDILSNGFKPRGANSTNDATNGPSHTIIYAAWAEAPTVNLYGGGANAR